MKVLIQAKRLASTTSTQLSRHKVQPALINTEHEKRNLDISQLQRPALHGHSFANISIHPQNTATNLEPPQSNSRHVHESHEHGRHPGHSFARLSLFPPERKNSTGLPDTLKAGVEHLSGLSMDDVSVHYHSSKPAQVRALAYTQGVDIHVGPGQEKYLPHEMWHVVQQKQGRVQPTLQARSLAVNDDQGLEREADVMGTRAATIKGGLQPFTKRLQFSQQPLKILQAVWEKQSDADYWRWDVEKDGVTWFLDADGIMWYKITNLDQVNKLDKKKKELYESYEGKKFSYLKWVSETKASLIPPRPTQQAEVVDPKSKAELKREENIGSRPIPTQTNDPISKIQQARLEYEDNLPGSRSRVVYYFDANGDALKPEQKDRAKYFVDTAKDATLEAENYKSFLSQGIRAPKVYGYTTPDKYPILQWIKKQTTIDAYVIGPGKLLDRVKERMKEDLDELRDVVKWREKWGRTLQDVQILVNKGYTSRDPQFMIDDVSGEVYIMDLEAESQSQLGKEPHKVLTELQSFLQKCINISDETNLRAFLTAGSEVQTRV